MASRVSDEVIQQVLDLLNAGPTPQREIAAQTGVSRSMVQLIWAGKVRLGRFQLKPDPPDSPKRTTDSPASEKIIREARAMAKVTQARRARERYGPAADLSLKLFDDDAERLNELRAEQIAVRQRAAMNLSKVTE